MRATRNIEYTDKYTDKYIAREARLSDVTSGACGLALSREPRDKWSPRNIEVAVPQEVADIAAAGAAAEDGDVVRVAAEVGDLVLNPAQRADLVLHA